MRIKSTVFLIFIFFLVGCGQEIQKEYYLTLMGESEHWKLTNYEIEITPDKFKAGNGTLQMKGADEYKTDSFHVKVRAVINGEDTVISSFSVTGPGVDIAKEDTGGIEGDTYYDEEGNPITLDDISNIYMVIEWWDVDQGKNVKERIDLYSTTVSKA